MSTVTLGGAISSALTHFALYGLADIAADRFGSGVTLGWTGEQEPKAWVGVPSATAEEISQAVLDAASTDAPRDWPSVQLNYSSKAVASPFSPRIKAIDTDKHPADWERHQHAREDALDALTDAGDLAELRFLAALGEASYWHIANNTRQPDRGASRWEMKTRNRGEEFISQRYGPLCRDLSTWSCEQVFEGLSGAGLRDPLGKNKQDSRSSTGFTRPTPTDNALVFCALRGIAEFPLAHRVSKINTTPGAWPDFVLHPRSMLLPVPTAPVTLARLRSVIVSRQLAILHEFHMSDTEMREGRDGTHVVSPLDAEVARTWLASRRCDAVVRFPIFKTGSSSAPERQVLDGEVHLNVG
jgi:CRISPR-associated protein Csb3